MRLHRPWIGIASLVCCWFAVQHARADNWPQWRGARFDGVSLETGLPAEWNKASGKNIAWRLALPGPAGATPVVWQDHLFLTSVDGSDLVLIAADTSGKQLWKKTVGSGNKNVRGDEGNSASPSPATDGKHVWTMMGTGVLACYDFAGNQIWKIDLQKKYGQFLIQHGFSSSPVLDGDRLYLQLIHSGGAKIVCLDKATGEQVWMQRRKTDARDECQESYATPTIYRDQHQALLLTHGGDYIIAHRLSDGEEVWRCGGLNPKGQYNNSLRLVASPLAVPGIIIVPSAKNGPVMALRPDGHGDITNDAQTHYWTHPHNTPDVPSPLVYDGLAYLCRENGNLYCFDVRTGEQYYEHRTHPDRHRASPLYADGKIYLASRDGTVTVVKAGRQYEELASNTMGEDISASPIVADGTLYLRTFEALYAIRAPRKR
ncbi:MAG TPA: PQQ-binding-like beta-propeller repeat protein [Pirellulales bacterium]|jgi:outer membrane protein assembly factor BamB|nr:PQQ-binding-like beta-propeller repeat protein [Pirellulales bacterium]